MTEHDIRFTLVDGAVVETRTALFLCLADRIAFERTLGLGYNELAGGPKTWHDEWIAFFAWRALVRDGQTALEWPAFADQIAKGDVTMVPNDGPEDERLDPPDRSAPVTAGPPRGSSPGSSSKPASARKTSKATRR